MTRERRAMRVSELTERIRTLEARRGAGGAVFEMPDRFGPFSPELEAAVKGTALEHFIPSGIIGGPTAQYVAALRVVALAGTLRRWPSVAELQADDVLGILPPQR